MRNTARNQPNQHLTFLSASDAAAELGVARRVLRSWDESFAVFAPAADPGRKRLYGPIDMAAARALKRLLLVDNKSVEDVVALIAEIGAPAVIEIYGLPPERGDIANANPAHMLQGAVRSAAAAGFFGAVVAEVPHPEAGEGDGANAVASYAQARVARLVGGRD
ncbi:MAG: MerR family transcriptional regulator [Hyphomonadaceae bacterium]